MLTGGDVIGLQGPQSGGCSSGTIVKIDVVLDSNNNNKKVNNQ